jgi:hypothetical protein
MHHGWYEVLNNSRLTIYRIPLTKSESFTRFFDPYFTLYFTHNGWMYSYHARAIFVLHIHDFIKKIETRSNSKIIDIYRCYVLKYYFSRSREVFGTK